MVWKFIFDRVVDDTNSNGDIEIQGFGFDIFDGYYGYERKV